MTFEVPEKSKGGAPIFVNNAIFMPTFLPKPLFSCFLPYADYGTREGGVLKYAKKHLGLHRFGPVGLHNFIGSGNSNDSGEVVAWNEDERRPNYERKHLHAATGRLAKCFGVVFYHVSLEQAEILQRKPRFFGLLSVGEN
jgi:hypothetical protein